MRVIANACEPSSNVPPPTEEASIRSPSTSTVARAGRPRNPYPQNMRETFDAPPRETDRDDDTPPSLTPRNQSPDLISTTQPTDTSAIVGSPSASGASATATQQDSSPAIAGRVPSIGSTTSTKSASGGATKPRSSE